MVDMDTDPQQRPYKRSRLNKNSLKQPCNTTSNNQWETVISLDDFDITTSKSRLHAQHPYRQQPIDLQQLSSTYPSIRQYVIQHKNDTLSYQWNNTAGLHEFTRICLLHYHNIQHWSIPSQNLCPALTQRINYLCWIQHDLLLNTNQSVHGIDIGTGASLIFPLLAHRMYQHTMTGTDIDIDAIANANKLIEQNQLSSYIKLINNEQADTILCNVIPHQQSYTYTICNPPFFSDISQAQRNLQRSNNATYNELVVDGGELHFIQQHITDSALYNDTIGWFTSMCGLKSTLNTILKQLRSNSDIKCVKYTTMTQGQQSRWAVAWTYQMQYVDPLIQNHKQNNTYDSTLKRKRQYTITVRIDGDALTSAEQVRQIIETIDLNNNDDNTVPRVNCCGSLYDYTVTYQIFNGSNEITLIVGCVINVLQQQLIITLTNKSIETTESSHLFHTIIERLRVACKAQ